MNPEMKLQNASYDILTQYPFFHEKFTFTLQQINNFSEKFLYLN